MAVTGENGAVYEPDTNTGHGLKVFNATTEWTEYSQPVKIEENMLVRLIIRPNIKGTNNTGLPDDYTLPVSHWFDNFALNEAVPSSIEANTVNNNVRVYALNGSIQISTSENTNVNIYNMNGALVDQLNNINGTTARTVAPGFYTVKAVSPNHVQTFKVLVK